MADASLKAGEGDGAKIIANILAESVKSHFKE